MAEVESRVSTDNLARDHLYGKRMETQSSLVGLYQCSVPCVSCLCAPALCDDPVIL